MSEEYENDPGLFDESEMIPAEEPESTPEPKDESEKDDDTGEDAEKVAEDSQEDDSGGDEGADEESAESESEPSTPAPAVTDETEIDLGEEKVTVADLKEAYGIRDEATKKIAEATATTENVKAVVEHLKKEPMAALEHIFANVFQDKAKAKAHIIALSEQVVAKHLEFETKSESEKEAIRRAEEAEELRKQLKAREEADSKRLAEAEEAELLEKITKDIKENLATAELGDSKRAVSDVSDILLRASQAGLTVTTAQAVRQYKKDLARRKQELLEELDPDELPEKVRERLTKRNIEKVKKSRSAKKTKTSERKSESEYKVLTQDEWDEY